LVTSKGAAGVAGSAIVVVVSTLAATGIIPVAAVAIILGVHRPQSSAFVSVNILGKALATIVIGQWEGAVDWNLLISGLTKASTLEESAGKWR
jgi:aerobic C4-dicarboxylate transport protein